jgi:tetratricopeptide (TPR) repeat protein
VPLPLALLMWLGAFGIYFAMAAMFYETSPPAHKMTILCWCLLFWIPPVFYYSWIVVDSLGTRSVDRIGPFSAHIEDPSEFAAARKLALRGDIDGAVAMYRQYKDNQANALFEAARLLKAEERLGEAAAMYEEIAARFKDHDRIWAEANYFLAKLKEINLRDPKAAMILLRKIAKRVPEGRFGQLASSDWARLQVMHEDFLDEISSAEAQDAPPSKHVPKPPLDAVVPERDPFFRPRDAEEPAGEDKPTPKKPARKRTSSAKNPANQGEPPAEPSPPARKRAPRKKKTAE